ncbi:MAG: NFACT RNA binding domain-containing protein [Spirochaetia bacterium]
MNDIGPLNYEEIDKVLSELQLKRSFLKKVIQPDFKSLVLTFLREDESVMRVFFDLCAYSSALYPIPVDNHNLKNKDLRFVQLLRSQCQGGYIEDVYQYEKERIIVFHVKHLEKKKFLYVRLWGTRSNIFLCDESQEIVDVFYRRPKSQEFSGQPYVMPEKRPVLADFKPRVIEGRGSLGERLYRLYFFLREENDVRNSALDEFLQWHQSKWDDILLKRGQLVQKLMHNQKSAEEAKKIADLLMIADSLENRIDVQAKTLQVVDFEGDRQIVLIDPLKTCIENAQAYYEKKKKLNKEKDSIQERLIDISAQEDMLGALWDRQSDLEFLKQKEWQKKEHTKPAALQGLFFRYEEYIFCVGRNARENELLLRKFARGRDWWLHVRDFSGAYIFVIVKKNIAVLPQEIMLMACELAANYSKGKEEKVIDVYLTQVKYLKKVKKQPGKVLVSQEKNISYRRDNVRLGLIMSRRMI